MFDVVRIAGEDGVSVSNQERERRIRDVAWCGASASSRPQRRAREWIERPLQETRKRSGEPRLTRGIAPDLGDDTPMR